MAGLARCLEITTVAEEFKTDFFEVFAYSERCLFVYVFLLLICTERIV